ncbi:MAG: pyruvate dehydrogenase (acetyl-transferring), homodimeric type [Planctomycetes bacterium]|nr:pyruvate dehydrogenase (acetyl-transferring), homodimeric type [Planctomycetota bacterium]
MSLEAIPDQELVDWLASLDYVIQRDGVSRAELLLSFLNERAFLRGVEVCMLGNTPHVNTIPPDEEPVFPGDVDLERRLTSLMQWNAMAMVVQANRQQQGIGGHVSTYSSAATLWEVGFNHFWRGGDRQTPGDLIFFQGHGAPGVYARAYLEGRLSETQLHNFRRELLDEPGLPSYPHPWLMSEFWEMPTVSMGLGPIMGIYQARFAKHLVDRRLMEPNDRKVWVLCGDGEMDEPESTGAIHFAGNQRLDNLIFVINCNLQRLDGPVRGNSSVVQELERFFRGAGWRVIKVLWGGDWDPLLASPAGEKLIRRMGEVCDGDYQKYVVAGPQYMREHFFGTDPDLEALVADLADEKLASLHRGGHDMKKVYAAYRAAVETRGRPTVILAQTVKGYGQGEAGEGRNISHKQKDLNEEQLLAFRTRLGLPLGDREVAEAPFYKPADDSPEIRYLHQRRQALGGYLPHRIERAGPLKVPDLDDYANLLERSDRPISTTMAFVRLLSGLLRDESIGRYVVPIVPDEARTFGMESLFRQCGIYSHTGQTYEPVDSDKMLYYREATDGQILEEGITEAGCASSFIAAGTSYAVHGIPTIPIFMFYSMFGFQRVGDLIWAAGDSRARGFLIGGTAGRTTLGGEGLQHQDGHSLLTASAYPTVQPYDPATAYETVVLTLDGLRRMAAEGEPVIYYMTIYNENHLMPPLPEGAAEGITRGLYRFSTRQAGDGDRWVELMASGSILFEAFRAQEILEQRYGVSSRLWSATSWTLLARDAMQAERWSRLHGDAEPRRPYLHAAMGEPKGPVLAVSDWVRAVPGQIRPWLPSDTLVLGTDGFGRSDVRVDLRRFFEISAEHIVAGALYQLARRGRFDRDKLTEAMADLKIETDGPAPWTV